MIQKCGVQSHQGVILEETGLRLALRGRSCIIIVNSAKEVMFWVFFFQHNIGKTTAGFSQNLVEECSMDQGRILNFDEPQIMFRQDFVNVAFNMEVAEPKWWQLVLRVRFPGNRGFV